MKVNKLRRCYDLGHNKFPEGIFMATTHDGAHFLWYFHSLFTLRPLQNSHEEALCSWEEFCSWKNQKQKKKRNAQRRKKGYYSVKKRKKFLCQSDLYWQSSMLVSRFWTKKSPSNQNLPYLMLKTSIKYQPWYENINNCLKS